MLDVSIAGVGSAHLPLAERDASERILRRDALESAIADSGFDRTEIDGYITTAAPMDDVRFLGLAPRFACAVDSGGASAGAAIITAIGAIASGVASVVACTFASVTRPGTSIGDVSHAYPLLWGLSGAVASHAMLARRYLDRYDADYADLGEVAVAQRALAGLRPDAQYHDVPLSLDEYLDSPLVIDPLRLLDCCRDANVGAVLILARGEVARERCAQPIRLAGIGAGENLRHWHAGDVFDWHDDLADAQSRAFAQAGLSRRDVDVAQLYDPFTISVLMQLEHYGFCDPGEAGEFVRSGATGIGGTLPVNTGGGQLSGFYAMSFTGLLEGVRQLRGQGGPTQVPDAKVALVSAHGGSMGVPNTWHHVTMLLSAER